MLDAKAMVEEDFSFTKNFGVKEINGKKYLTINGELANVIERVSKSHFINTWLVGFTLGTINDRNYFDFRSWGEVSDDGRASVAVYDDLDPQNILFVIPSLIDMNLNREEMKGLMEASLFMSQAQNATDSLRATEILSMGNEYIKKIINKEVRTLSDLVPDWLYAELGIIPQVYRQMIYCRDRYKLESGSEAWKMTEACFRLINDGIQLNQEQIDFLMAVTHNEYQLPDNLEKKQNTKTLLSDPSIEPDFDNC